MSTLKSNNAELLLDTRSVLGEGPVWDWRGQRLFWVDIEGCQLHAYDPSTKNHHTWHFDDMIGAAVPTEMGNWLLALESGPATFNLTNHKLTRHAVLQNSNKEMRYNDGKVGPNGNFWVGSMHKKAVPERGDFYRVSPAMEVEKYISKTSISNGMAWTLDHNRFYYIDTAHYQVWHFDYNKENGKIDNKKVVFSIPKNLGGPDGMSIDEEDMLWIAHWGGACVRRWNPKTGKVLEQIKVDAPHVTSCCFGGKDLKRLYITTARSGLTDDQLEKFPKSGGLFTVDVAVAGTPITYFKDN